MSDNPVRESANESDHALQQGRAVTTPSFDTLFDLLADRRRRYALYALVGAEEGLTDLSALVDEVAMQEARNEERKLTDSLCADIADELREEHLPKIAEADIVDYDDRSETVRYWRQPTLEEYLEHTHFKEFADA
ncbi:DUF7344 domain-containing protein [Halorussus halophilus]|uniref:DUF7344 domain-containing protein n=1 Tax=Halorussus halophilus TaxID=2650975 RepID=UPI001CE44F87|nr:hypothetical protein [Halorussus halophilus]